MCTCGHQPWLHGLVTYPRHREPCKVCVRCGTAKRCVGGCRPCSCQYYVESIEAVAL